MNMKKIAIATVLAAAVACIALSRDWGAARAGAASAQEAPLVSVSAVQARDLPLLFAVQGHAVPLNQVEVRPQITGVVKAVHFKEGDRVASGQLLFTLDGSDAAAMLNRARAMAAQVKAQLDDARRGVQRSRSMVASGFIAPSALETDRSKVEALQAQLAGAQADIDNARIQLERTRIVAPVAGRTGAVDVHPGSLAQLNAVAALVNIVQLDPIAVEFKLPEQDLAALRAAQSAGTAAVRVEGVGGASRSGELTFIDSSVNTTSGTITLKARFANQDLMLWPGAFVRVVLEAGRQRDATVVPPHAILEGPAGRFVYVVGADGRAGARPVGLLRVQQQDAVVTGVRRGDRVVVEGGQQVHAGELVRVK
jgi:RND family efflux transporter MFP subunit